MNEEVIWQLPLPLWFFWETISLCTHSCFVHKHYICQILSTLMLQYLIFPFFTYQNFSFVPWSRARPTVYINLNITIQLLLSTDLILRLLYFVITYSLQALDFVQPKALIVFGSMNVTVYDLLYLYYYDFSIAKQTFYQEFIVFSGKFVKSTPHTMHAETLDRQHVHVTMIPMNTQTDNKYSNCSLNIHWWYTIHVV